MRESITNFHTQFAYEPAIENAAALKPAHSFIVVGMGGSHLAADLLRVWNPSFEVLVHHGYSLPLLPDVILRERLIVLCSHSGNTEETLSAFDEARERKLSCAVIGTGGKLIERAKKEGLPHIQTPDTGIQPRAATGFTLKALLALMRHERASEEAEKLSSLLVPEEFETQGQVLAEKLNGFVPVIYASGKNQPLAYNWKIKFNETGKIPAFWNTLPELNHNEMTGFDVADTTKALSKHFYFLLLEDPGDDPSIQKRMRVLKTLYRDRDLRVETIPLSNTNNIFYNIFSSLVLADWTAYYTAKSYGVEPEQVPMVEEFKKLIA